MRSRRRRQSRELAAVLHPDQFLNQVGVTGNLGVGEGHAHIFKAPTDVTNAIVTRHSNRRPRDFSCHQFFSKNNPT